MAPPPSDRRQETLAEPPLTIARSALDAIVAHAAAEAPHECCGLLLGLPSAIEEARPAANRAAEPRASFEIDAQALVDAHRAARSGGPEVIGYYHSHPRGPSEPSLRDRAQAAHDGRIWAIAAPGGVTFRRDDEPGFVSLPYAVVDR